MTGERNIKNNITVGNSINEVSNHKIIEIHIPCADCPVCYNVVQDHVNKLRRKLSELRLIIENIGDNPQAIDDADFKRQMSTVNTLVVRLLQDARRFSGMFYYDS
jgi:hypothetical protein